MGEGLFDGRPLRAVIDVSAFQHNISRVEQRLPDAKVLVVIKADAYGHGLVEMARAAGGRDLAVATPNEASALLDAGITNRIWVLEGPFSEACLSLSAQSEIIWVLHSQWQIDLIKSLTAETQFQCWLKIDTGMHRLGFDPDVVEGALRQCANSAISVEGLMSHFAESDLPESSAVQAQKALFDELIRQHDLGDYAISLANSGAVLYYDCRDQDWVRPGIMLYGGMPNPSEDRTKHDLKAVMAFESKIIALRRISKGESVGYGARWTADRESLIAVIACGYGDGYPRHAVNGTPVYIGGQVVPLVGRVSMDMITADVTDLANVAVGDMVELWGQHVSVDQVAAKSDTIAYDLLTGITRRVPRDYINR